jgi:valyl-tRNA synthetase
MVETATSTPYQRAYTFLATAQPIVARTAPSRCPTCQQQEFVQDSDVLDTWFSSALWPFSTLGWPEQTPDLNKFYPTSALVTGLDILFFWVARMIMMGLKFMGDVPFRDVYIHALVRDAEGQKMSKSKGNIVDPLHVMEQYGTDALRFTLASMASPGRDIKLAEERIEGYRNFTNKIWNAARFILMNLDGPRETVPPKDRPFADRWILSRLNRTIQDVNTSLAQYRFDQAASHLYQFIWHEYCDWYLEMIKPSLQNKDSAEAKRTRQTLVETFETVQRLLHHFMPFISEEIWQTLPHTGESIVTQPFPTASSDRDAQDIEARFSMMERFVSTVRMERNFLDYSPAKHVRIFGSTYVEKEYSCLQALKSFIEHFGKGQATLMLRQDRYVGDDFPEDVLRLPNETLTVGVLVEKDVDIPKVIGRIGKQFKEKDEERGRLSAKLKTSDFIKRAPQEVLDEYDRRLHTINNEVAIYQSTEDQLMKMWQSRIK